jgi:anti-anti-sigma factor
MFNCIYKMDETNQQFILSGKLDQESFADFDNYVQQNYVIGKDVILNLDSLEYISSVGLRSFIIIAKMVRSDKKNIKLKAKEGSMVRQLITLSGFTKIMPFI